MIISLAPYTNKKKVNSFKFVTNCGNKFDKFCYSYDLIGFFSVPKINYFRLNLVFEYNYCNKQSEKIRNELTSFVTN